MSEDPINEEDEIEESVDEAETEDADDEALESDEVSYAVSSKAVTAEALEDFSIASRQKIRNEIEDQIAAFIARGGQIAEVAPNITADPPKKPTPDYGGRPI